MHKIKAITTKKNIKKFIKENGFFMTKLAVMGVVALTTGDSAFAQTTGSAGNVATGSLSTLVTPLTTVKSFMTGTVPQVLVSSGVVMAGASYAMNIDNQAVKSFMRIGGGGSVALGAVPFIDELAGLIF